MGYLPKSVIKLMSPTSTGRFFNTEPPGKPKYKFYMHRETKNNLYDSVYCCGGLERTPRYLWAVPVWEGVLRLYANTALFSVRDSIQHQGSWHLGGPGTVKDI